MSVLILETQLEDNKPYVINKVSHLQSDVLKLIGLKAIFKNVNGSTASVQVTGRMMSVPVRALVTVKGYEFKAVSYKNADGFVVTSKNDFGFKVGTTFLNPEAIDSNNALFNIDGKSIQVPLNILSSIVRKKEKAVVKVTKELRETSKTSGIPLEVIQDLDNSKNREDLYEVPPFLVRVLPNLYIEDIVDVLKDKEGVFADYDGNIHATISEADKSNVLIRHKQLEVKFVELLELETKRQFENIRNKH